MKKLVFTICMLILTLNATDTNQDDFGIIDIDYESRSMMLNMIKKKYFDASLDNITIDTYGGLDKYYFVGYTTYQTDLGGRISGSAACFDVFDRTSITNTQGFCFNNSYTASISQVDRKGNYITIVSEWQGVWPAKTYLTFRLIGDRFYLHQYSRENENVSNEGNVESIKSHIYYRQPRDDPKKENLIPLDSINDELLQRLGGRCYETGLCKEID